VSHFVYLPDAALAINLERVEVVSLQRGTAQVAYADGNRVVTSRRDLHALVEGLAWTADDQSRLALRSWLATSEKEARAR
jgi:hypothetical protein